MKPVRLRATDSGIELEKQLAGLRHELGRLTTAAETKSARVESLIELRDPLASLGRTVNNALLCSVLYGEHAHHRALDSLRASVHTLVRANEERISTRFRSRTETAAVDKEIGKRVSALPLTVTPEICYSAYLDGSKVRPLCAVQYRKVTDVAGFAHDQYSIWFRGPNEFASGFGSWPGAEGWQRVKNRKELISALRRTMQADGMLGEAA